MEVAVPPTMSPEFNIDGAPAFAYASAPASPSGEPFNHRYRFTSAPTSPSIYSQIPAWGNPNPDLPTNDDDDDEGCDFSDFAFPTGRQYGSGGFRLPEIATADRLFEKGRIRTLEEWGRSSSVKSARSGRRESRSVSPRRDDGLQLMNTASPANPAKGGAARRWPRLKDLLLFRSASEGRVTGRGSKDLLFKYSLLSHVSLSNKKKFGEDKKNSGGELARRGGGPAVSAHERHYTACRAMAEQQRKKTPLPFQRQGLLGLIAIRGKNKGGGNTNTSTDTNGWSLTKGKF